MLPAKSGHDVGRIVLKVVVLLFPIAWLVILAEPKAHAVPSYSRQTGLACVACHYTPLELNAFGRKFKLDGYVFVTKPQITDDGKDHNATLALLEALPLSVLFDASYVSTKRSQPGTENGNFQIPQDVGVFIAGSYGNHIGSFVQFTYNATGNHFNWDNSDVRYANSHELFGKSFNYGLTFNNNPTVEDLWNSTPAWGFPFQNTNAAPTPITTPVLNQRLAQDLAGFGGYAMFDEHFYIAAAVYRSDHLGGPQPNPGTGFPFNIRGVAPYWRVAWQTATKNNNLEIGTYGFHVKTSPGTVVGPMDGYTDYAFDFQYDRVIPQFKGDVISFRGNYIRENSSLAATFANGGAMFPRHHLNFVEGNVEYHYGSKLSGTVAGFGTNGTPDPLLFMQAAVTGSANGDPRSTGYILNATYWPVQNWQLTAQYTGYLRFNGAQNNYDGAHRNANANNSIFLLVRFIF